MIILVSRKAGRTRCAPKISANAHVPSRKNWRIIELMFHIDLQEPGACSWAVLRSLAIVSPKRRVWNMRGMILMIAISISGHSFVDKQRGEIIT